MKHHACKVGTLSSLTVILFGNSKPKVGRVIRFRYRGDRTKWMVGRVTQIREDGFFFMDLE